MNTRLNHCVNWLELAQKANWSVATLAQECGVSTRTLERHFLKTAGKTPKMWLNEQRQNQAQKLLRHGRSVKEIASELGYRYPNHFSCEFKKHWGVPPTAAATRPVAF